ncbi:hypothetical protein GUITHDRAFT_147153 [Guillardia theta CCMP2712]|uniref:IC97/Casc1 N-terminal domain-containing protein n=1 Tax=Guillardia theta (strain CCMP2712) TaxID=905079 RepID=L1IE87_GUITC|nr:hypothetical protein GUITHDRAFT_147153 [Guillardia theta CCMP2712]EKX34543.1 hypothetical protein GUITHDRAFT_147153 [Guillardia theta CCMP2712]|eukprot:XP_005821523.1 hypothetical protein GUITHDRAFT_147153 [Guillardia theta CCMP2712]
MPPKPADGKNNSKKKAEELQLLLDRVEKMINKANANIDISKSERNLLLMQDSLTILESAQELLNNNPIKLPAKEKKKKIQPLQSSIDLIKHDFTQAVEEEQKLRRVEAVQEWTCVEVGQILNERSMVKSVLLSIKDKLQEEYKKRDEELDWQLWVSCNHLPDPRSEVALNDFINDWEKDKATSEFAVLAEEIDSSFEVIQQCLQLVATEKLQVCQVSREKMLVVQEDRMKSMLKELLHCKHMLRVTREDDDGSWTRTNDLRTHKKVLLEYYRQAEKLSLHAHEEGGEERTRMRTNCDIRASESERIKTLNHIVARTKEIGARKLDTMTMDVLLHPHSYMTTEDSRFWQQRKHLTVCMWVNLTKNLRLKEIEFPVRNLRMSIPQNLIMKSIALRAILIDNFELVQLPSTSKSSLPAESQHVSHPHVDSMSDPPHAQVNDSRQRWEEDGKEEEDVAVGGVLLVQCLNLPREPKKVGAWSMREEVEGGSGQVEEMPYPSIDAYTGQEPLYVPLGPKQGQVDAGRNLRCSG